MSNAVPNSLLKGYLMSWNWSAVSLIALRPHLQLSSRVIGEACPQLWAEGLDGRSLVRSCGEALLNTSGTWTQRSWCWCTRSLWMRRTERRPLSTGPAGIRGALQRSCRESHRRLPWRGNTTCACRPAPSWYRPAWLRQNWQDVSAIAATGTSPPRWAYLQRPSVSESGSLQQWECKLFLVCPVNLSSLETS